MKFSAILLAAAAGLVSAQKFGLIAIHSGTDVQNAPINSNGVQLVIGAGEDTTYEVIDRGLYANGKPIEFGQYALIKERDGEATRDIIVNGQDNLYVARFDFVACPDGKGGYVLADQEACPSGAIGIAARAVYDTVSSSSAAAETTSGVVTSHSTVQVTVTSCSDDACHKATAAAAAPAAPAKSTPAAAPPAASPAKTTPAAIVTQIGDGQIQAPKSVPVQANGATALGVSAAAGAIVVAAMLF
ncbi:hypothetical protein CJU90_6385 [Yarrowia sp. C11]|nr:hypothetical protein CJU90_6385 [Yarrowia sp. C11]KAG5371085.1 hypothetical protein CKK34_1225 [Yarrowia sp. E02]